MQQLTHIDLFSGIGGFSLASAWADFKTIVFCEKDKFCHKILNKHWPSVPIIEDIHEFKGEQYIGAALLTGGVPCQPASTAGKRRGTEDDRWLWPETLRIIREAKPKWIILENVRGLVSLNGGLEFDNLLSEVEAIGYETRPFIIPACSVNAPHRRERVWIVANTTQLFSHDKQPKPGVSPQAESSDREPGGESGKEPLANTYNTGRIQQQQPVSELQKHTATQCSSGWRSLSNLGYMADGLPTRLVGHEPNIPKIVTEKVPDRVAKLRALGNAIVPQVAYQIIEKITMIELGLATTKYH